MQKYNFFFKYKETNSLLSFFMNQDSPQVNRSRMSGSTFFYDLPPSILSFITIYYHSTNNKNGRTKKGTAIS